MPNLLITVNWIKCIDQNLGNFGNNGHSECSFEIREKWLEHLVSSPSLTVAQVSDIREILTTRITHVSCLVWVQISFSQILKVDSYFKILIAWTEVAAFSFQENGFTARSVKLRFYTFYFLSLSVLPLALNFFGLSEQFLKEKWIWMQQISLSHLCKELATSEGHLRLAFWWKLGLTCCLQHRERFSSLYHWKLFYQFPL